MLVSNKILWRFQAVLILYLVSFQQNFTLALVPTSEFFPYLEGQGASRANFLDDFDYLVNLKNPYKLLNFSYQHIRIYNNGVLDLAGLFLVAAKLRINYVAEFQNI